MITRMVGFVAENKGALLAVSGAVAFLIFLASIIF